MDILNDIINDSAADPTKAVLARVSAMVELVRDAEQRRKAAEIEEKRYAARLFKLQSEDLPELLREAGLTSVTLEDGTSVKVYDEISCSITQERAPEAHKWMREHGFGALIKTLVTVQFGKDSYAEADKLLGAMVKRYGDEAVEQKESVHASTLKSFIKERIAAAEPASMPPFALFGVQPYAMTKIAASKKGKA